MGRDQFLHLSFTSGTRDTGCTSYGLVARPPLWVSGCGCRLGGHIPPRVSACPEAGRLVKVAVSPAASLPIGTSEAQLLIGLGFTHWFTDSSGSWCPLSQRALAHCSRLSYCRVLLAGWWEALRLALFLWVSILHQHSLPSVQEEALATCFSKEAIVFEAVALPGLSWCGWGSATAFAFFKQLYWDALLRLFSHSHWALSMFTGLCLHHHSPV